MQNALRYPARYETIKKFKNNFEVYFLPIKASDEDMMRRLFYQFSDEAKYLRYFSSIRSMPHDKMQTYVNIDYLTKMSIVGVIFHKGVERIIAEGMYAYYQRENTYEIAFVVDEAFQGRGVASYIMDYLITIARDKPLKTLTGYVLNNNDVMLKVFQRARITPDVEHDDGETIFTFHIEEDFQISLKM